MSDYTNDNYINDNYINDNTIVNPIVNANNNANNNVNNNANNNLIVYPRNYPIVYPSYNADNNSSDSLSYDLSYDPICVENEDADEEKLNTVYFALDAINNCIRFGKINVNKSLDQIMEKNYTKMDSISYKYSMTSLYNASLHCLNLINFKHASGDRFESLETKLIVGYNNFVKMMYSLYKCKNCQAIICLNNKKNTTCPVCKNII